MGRKGVSPLIAAVLLIAFTMSVATILTMFVTQFTEEQTDFLENQSSKKIECQFADVDIYSTSYDSGELSVTVANMGSVDLPEVNVQAIGNGELAGSKRTGKVEVSGLETVTINLSGEPDKVRAIVVECPSKIDEKTQIS